MSRTPATSIFRRRRWQRLGCAFGMLAMLALAALVPIHHIHALKRDLAGIATGAPAVMTDAGAGHAHAAHGAAASPDPAAHCHDCGSGHRPDSMPPNCPVCTLGKMAAALLLPAGPAVALPSLAAIVWTPEIGLAGPSGRPERIAQPRAPPAEA